MEVGKPYRVAVSSRRKGLTVHHQSSFLKPAVPKHVASTEVVQARRVEADARRDEKRAGAIRVTGPPIPVRIEWKGKVGPTRRTRDVGSIGWRWSWRTPT